LYSKTLNDVHACNDLWYSPDISTQQKPTHISSSLEVQVRTGYNNGKPVYEPFQACFPRFIALPSIFNHADAIHKTFSAAPVQVKGTDKVFDFSQSDKAFQFHKLCLSHHIWSSTTFELYRAFLPRLGNINTQEPNELMIKPFLNFFSSGVRDFES